MLAEAGHFVQINAGAAVRLGKVELEIDGVETQALLEARLHNVTAILARVLTTLDRNPELLESVGQALGDVGGGAHDLLGDTGEVVRSAGKGARSAVSDVGRGAGKGVAGIGQGAQQGVEGLGQGAQQGVQGLGQGAQQGVQGVGKGLSRASRGSAKAPSKASKGSPRTDGRGVADGSEDDEVTALALEPGPERLLPQWEAAIQSSRRTQPGAAGAARSQ